jgi:hypothetical protein
MSRVSSMTGAEQQMSMEWLAWSNPVALWWGFMIVVSGLNVALWLSLYRQSRKNLLARVGATLRIELMTWLCAAYVFGCAFRSMLPRADVQRICLFDTWLSSAFVGRSVATVAEIRFVIQWVIILSQMATLTKSAAARGVSKVVVPLIVLAECFSWYAVLTTNYLGNAVENSIWAASFALIAAALLRMLSEFRGVARLGIGIAVAGIVGYFVFIATTDVPMYLGRWQADMAKGKEHLDVVAGLYDAMTRRVVTRDLGQWGDEITWMSLYFSAAVWSSLALCSLYVFGSRALEILGQVEGSSAVAQRRRSSAARDRRIR